MPATTFDFDRDTAVAPVGGGVYRGLVVDGWDIAGNANGGYLAAIAVAAMRAESGRSDPVTVTTHFLAPGRPGPVEVRTAVVKAGKRFTTVTGSMFAGDRLLLQVLAAFGELTGDDGDPLFVGGAPPDLPPIDRCTPRRREVGGVVVQLVDRLHIDLDPACAGFQTGAPARPLHPPGAAGPSDPAEMRGWVRFTDGRPWDALALLLACDCFPPAVFNLDLPPGWVPTVELSIQVRSRPAPGPLRARMSTRFVSGGFLEEDSELWDDDGRLVALSRQLALLARA